MTYTILESLVPLFEQKLEKFQKKFSKFGQGTISFSKSEPYAIKSMESYVYVVDVDVEGSYKINNYKFIASLEWVEEVKKNLVKGNYDNEIIPEHYLYSTSCEHCGVERFRKYTVLLKNEQDGSFIQVGKSCVKDYLGVDVTQYAAYLSTWDSLEDYLEGLNKSAPSHGDVAYRVDDVLEQTCAQVRLHGYVSRNKALDLSTEYNSVQSTSSIMYCLMQGINDCNGNKYPRHEITEEDKEQAKQVKAFIKNSDDKSDYVNNLKTLCSGNYVNLKNLGLLVSAVSFYIRKTAEEKAKAEKIESQFVGNIGDKIEIKGIPTCVFSTDTQFGYYYIYKFIFENNEFVWKTSKSLADNREVTLKGTIKDHNEFNGIKQNELTRCRVQ